MLLQRLLNRVTVHTIVLHVMSQERYYGTGRLMLSQGDKTVCHRLLNRVTVHTIVLHVMSQERYYGTGRLMLSVIRGR